MSTGVQNSRISRLAARLGLDPAAVRSLLVALNVVLIVFVIVAVLSRCLGGMPQTASTEKALDDQSATGFATGFLPSLEVRAQPPGARIYLDGRFIGQSSEQMENLDPGEYTVTATHPDHDPAMRTIELAFGQHEKINLRLELITGSLQVHSTPPGARVELVGQNRSSFSPAVFEGLRPGRYRVRIQARNYLDHEQTLQVRRDQVTEYAVRLELNRRSRLRRGIRDTFSSVTGAGRGQYRPPPRSSSESRQVSPSRSAQARPPATARPQRESSSAPAEQGRSIERRSDAVVVLDDAATTTRSQRQALGAAEQETGRRESVAESKPENRTAPAQTRQSQSQKMSIEKDTRSGTEKPEPSRSLSPPRAIVSPQPEYPIRARRDGIEGEVHAEFTVTASGRVTAIAITGSEPRNVFDRAVRDALADWRFESGARSHRMSRVFEFTLADTATRSVNRQADTTTARRQQGVTRRPISRVEPDYPRQARINGTEGTVRFELEVRPDGSVGRVRLVDSHPSRVFDQAVRRAVARWQFEPSSGESWIYTGEIEFELK